MITVDLKPRPGRFRFEVTKNGWELQQIRPKSENRKLQFNEILRAGEERIWGHFEMRYRAIEMGNLAGEEHAEDLIKQQDTIPEELRPFVLLFMGTILGFGGSQHVVCLVWNERESEWVLASCPLVYNFDSRFRLARVSK